jgi:hypothetical protein
LQYQAAGEYGLPRGTSTGRNVRKYKCWQKR